MWSKKILVYIQSGPKQRQAKAIGAILNGEKILKKKILKEKIMKKILFGFLFEFLFGFWKKMRNEMCPDFCSCPIVPMGQWDMKKKMRNVCLDKKFRHAEQDVWISC